MVLHGSQQPPPNAAGVGDPTATGAVGAGPSGMPVPYGDPSLLAAYTQGAAAATGYWARMMAPPQPPTPVGGMVASGPAPPILGAEAFGAMGAAGAPDASGLGGPCHGLQRGPVMRSLRTQVEIWERRQLRLIRACEFLPRLSTGFADVGCHLCAVSGPPLTGAGQAVGLFPVPLAFSHLAMSRTRCLHRLLFLRPGGNEECCVLYSLCARFCHTPMWQSTWLGVAACPNGSSPSTQKLHCPSVCL